MEKKVRLCNICFKRKAGELNLCATCRTMDKTLSKLMQNRPKQAKDYIEQLQKRSSKAVRNRFMSKKVGG